MVPPESVMTHACINGDREGYTFCVTLTHNQQTCREVVLSSEGGERLNCSLARVFFLLCHLFGTSRHILECRLSEGGREERKGGREGERKGGGREGQRVVKRVQQTFYCKKIRTKQAQIIAKESLFFVRLLPPIMTHQCRRPVMS